MSRDIREYNRAVWRDTENVVKSGKIPPPPSSTKYSAGVLSIKIGGPIYDKTFIGVYNADTFDIAKAAIASGLNPLVLNMANHITPGGGVRNGACAQEECLFRRSNYFATLTKELYPLKDDEIIYSPDVTVFKSSEYKQCTPWKCSCMASAALRRTPAHSELYNEAEHKSMLLKIKMMFHLAVLNGHDSMILGAFGCGAFHNPPAEVCNIFEEVILEYDGYFKEIVFAVMSRDDNPNYDVFKSLEYLN